MKRLSLSLLLLCLGASNAMAFPSFSEAWNGVKSVWNSPWTQGAIKGSVAMGSVLALAYAKVLKDQGKKEEALLIDTVLVTLAGMGVGHMINSKQLIAGSAAAGLIFGGCAYKAIQNKVNFKLKY